MDYSQILTSPLAAFSAGVVTSLHCSGMCGPLTCALFGSNAKQQEGEGSGAKPWLVGGVYHFSRLISYSLIGGILATVGRTAANALFTSAPGRLLPWAFALVFLLMAFGLDRHIPKARFISGLLFRLKLKSMPRLRMGAVFGLLTPFLPCGPLYAVFAVCLFADSFLDGARIMAGFALGTMPLYWLLQTQYFRLQRKFSPGTLRWARQGLALVSAVLVGWRAIANDGAGIAKVTCIFCH
jgi:sulfite exporter TauE/SafE